MRTKIPNNNVCYDYKKVLLEFISQLRAKQNDNIVSIYLSGSYARGDATNNSDLDIFCVFKMINTQVLYDVGFCCHNTLIPYDILEINSQCMSIDEFNNDSFANWSETSIREIDSVALFGTDLCCNVISNEKAEKIYKKYLTEIVMSIRHYISVDAPLEKLSHQKIKTYILKPLMFALRIERYCKTGLFPLSIYDLLHSYNDEHRILIEYFLNKDMFDNDIANNHKDVFEKLHQLVCSLLL